MKCFITLKKGLSFSLLLVFLFFSPKGLSACDSSGNVINAITQNADGTFTIDMSIMVAGGISTGVGSTWGFWWMVDAPILSVVPLSLTSSNGTTINAVVAGNTVTWGDPVPSGSTPFLDIDANGPDEFFSVTIVIASVPSAWSSGGYEGNNCPGGAGTNPENYNDMFCFTPSLMAIPDEVTICVGDQTTLTVVPDNLTETVTWTPGGMTGNSIQVAPNETTIYTVTASNPCEEASIQYTVTVIQLPEIDPLESEIDICEGLPAVMEVTTQFEESIEWSPSGGTGNLLIDFPTMSPMVYTATATNQCATVSTDVTVTTIPFPSVEITNSIDPLCSNETITLETEATDDVNFTWQPGNITEPTIDISPTTTTTYTVVVSNFCGLATDSITVVIGTSVETEINLEACVGETALYNGIPLSAGSSSTFTFETPSGCDSVVTVNVAELMTVTNSVELEACTGNMANFNGQALAIGTVTDFTFQMPNGCDSVVTVTVAELPIFSSTLSLSVCAGTNATYNGQMLSPGSVTDFVLPSANGCDSTVTVSVNDFPTYNITENLETCTGVPILYNGQNLMPGSTTTFNFTSVNDCDSIVTVEVAELSAFTDAVFLETCTGSTATYNGQVLASNTVTDFNLTSVNGCDSIVTVTVTEVTAITETISFDACAGDVVNFNGQPLAAGSTTDFPFTTPQGCDSIVTVVVNELQTFNTTLQLETCEGTSVMYNGQMLAAGTTTDVLLSTFENCDSVVTVSVSELQNITASLALSACQGSAASFNGQPLAIGSSTDFTFQSFLGCDSILTVTVDELETFSDSLELQACTGSTAVFNGIELSPGTTIDFTLTATNGCDSIVSVTVNEVEMIEADLQLETCAGSTIPYNGQLLTAGSVTDFTFQAVNGCDSVVTVTVEELESIEENLSLDACGGGSVTFNSMDLAAGSTTEFSFVTAQGCDSILTVFVEELETFSSAFELAACTGSTVDYNGQALLSNTVTDFTLTAINGCDSVVTVTVNELLAQSDELELQACAGTSVDYNGQPLLPNTVTDFTLTAFNGCDSVVTVTVEEVTIITESLNLETCEGEIIFFNGMELAGGSVTDFNFTSTQGCDSILTISVEEFPNLSSSVEMEACEGSVAMFNGQPLTAGSVTDFVLTTFNGCDSVVTVTVEELLNVVRSISLQECEDVPLIYQGTEITPGTSMDFTFTSSVGCDSIVTVTGLEPLSIIETFEEIEICESETALIFGELIATPGLYSLTFISTNGCDSVHSVQLDFTNDIGLEFNRDIRIGLGESVELQPITTPFATLNFDWEADPTLSCLDCQNPLATPIISTTYTLTISNEFDCANTADVTVIVKKDRNVFIPNSFSPNDDGINDVFMIFSGEQGIAKVNSFLVFSRWGEAVYEFHDFQPNNPDFGWDGKYRGEEMNPAVFAYFAEIEFVDGVTQLFEGDVVLVK